MRTLGIRANPNNIFFAVFDTNAKEIINVETIKIPRALNFPDALKYVRSNILDILNEYEIEMAGIRITESNSQHLNIRRISIEGVIQESFASSGLSYYYCGQIANISARIGIERTQFKPITEGREDFPLVENWNEMSNEEREAVLTAIGAQHA